MFIEQAPEGTGPAAVRRIAASSISGCASSIEATVADLAARGIPLVSGITDVKPGLRIAFFEGPDGVRIEILQRG